MITVSNCLICNNNNLKPFQSCTDYTVSHETFQLKKCENCGFVLTSPRPDDSSIGQYYLSENYISHANKAASLIDKLYLIARIYTLNWKVKLLGDPGINKKILDYGCGTGEFLSTCKKAGWQISGIEPSEKARRQAEQSTSIPIKESLNDETESNFSAITLWHVLEHVPNLNEVLQELNRRLNPKGTMFIAVPNHKSQDAARYKENWAGYDVPRHLWHFSQHSMKLLLENNGLKLVRTVPMKLDSYYISLLSEKYKNQNKSSLTGLIKAFIFGSISNIKGRNTGEYSSIIYIVKK